MHHHKTVVPVEVGAKFWSIGWSWGIPNDAGFAVSIASHFPSLFLDSPQKDFWNLFV
jgi:hypothetical protein